MEHCNVQGCWFKLSRIFLHLCHHFSPKMSSMLLLLFGVVAADLSLDTVSRRATVEKMAKSIAEKHKSTSVNEPDFVRAMREWKKHFALAQGTNALRMRGFTEGEERLLHLHHDIAFVLLIYFYEYLSTAFFSLSRWTSCRL